MPAPAKKSQFRKTVRRSPLGPGEGGAHGGTGDQSGRSGDGSGVPLERTEDLLPLGEGLTQHAAVAMAGASNLADIQKALATRDIIGQAKGIMMERHNLTDVKAFNLLTRASQETNRKLVDVARWLLTESPPRNRDK